MHTKKSRNLTGKKAKKIVFLLTQDLESPSGLGRYFPISKYLVKSGLNVTILALHSDFSALVSKDTQIEGVDIHYVSQMHVKKHSNRTIYFKPIKLVWVSFIATLKFLSNLIKLHPDIVVIGKPHPMNSISGVLGGRLTKAKVVLDCDDYEAVSNYFSTKFQRNIIRFFEDNVPKWVDLVITNTLFTKNRLIKLGIHDSKIHYLPNGIDPDRFNNESTEEQLKIKQDLKITNQKVIAYIGSLNLSNHSVDLLVQAFNIVQTEMPETLLLVVGGGKDFQKLQELSVSLGIDKKVLFTGRIPPKMIPEYYRIANVSVDPVNDTDAEKGRCPLKIFESWVMGIPFITSDVGDRSILAGNPRAALLCQPGNVKELADSILKVINSPHVIKTFSDLGHERVKEYSWSHLLNDLLESIKDIK